MGAIAGFLYRRADRIVVVTPAFKDHLIRYWNVPADKISIVENGVETDLFRLDPTAAEVRKQLQLEDRFLICYIGTMGNAHGLETLIAAAEELQTALPNAMFLLIGEGAEKERIVDLAAARGLTNIQFLGQQPRERIPAYVSAADLCLVMLKKNELFKTVIPTKLLEYMACERPVIVAVDGQARQIVEEAGGGVFVEPENSKALVKAILELAEDPERRRTNGNQRAAIHRQRVFSRKNGAGLHRGVGSAWRVGAGVSAPHDLRMNRNDCQCGGQRHGCFRTAICRSLGRTSGYEQNVAFHQRHIRRLGIKYLLEADVYFLNPVRRLAQDPGFVQGRGAGTAAGQRQGFENTEGVVL